MKKTVLWALLALAWTASVAVAAELKVGERAADFKLKDSVGKEYSLASPEFKGMVLSIFYVDPDEKDMNVHVEDVLLKDPGLERDLRYKGLGITNLKATLLPNFIIKGIIKGKKEKTGAIILLDDDYTILNLWGLQNDSSNVLVLDKERICRYIYKGKLPADEVAKLVMVIKEYQAK